MAAIPGFLETATVAMAIGEGTNIPLQAAASTADPRPRESDSLVTPNDTPAKKSIRVNDEWDRYNSRLALVAGAASPAAGAPLATRDDRRHISLMHGRSALPSPPLLPVPPIDGRTPPGRRGGHSLAYQLRRVARLSLRVSCPRPSGAC